MQHSSRNSENCYPLKSFVNLFLLLFLILFLAEMAEAQNDSLIGRRPKLGLVLSGGGAKGFAHVGAIKVFEEAGLQFDYIGGTSMGSIIGGLYAMGYNPETMSDLIRNQDWTALLNDKVGRNFIPLEEKMNADRFVLTFPVKGKKVKIRQGMHDGQLINMLLAKTTSPVYNVTDFNKLPTPFVCIGTDLVTGGNVVMNRGSLAESLRASMSIPSFFTPMEIDGHLLVDGGVVNNYPVLEVKQMGADIIIGVDVQAGLLERDELTSMVSILDQITSFYRIDANDKAVAATDIFIKPDLEGYGMMSFTDYDSILKAGEVSARQFLPQLKRLADSLNSFGPEEPRIDTTRPLDSIFINVIQYKGLKKVSANFLEGSLNIKPLSWVKLKDLDEGVMRAYGSGFFESVNYSFLPDEDGADLVIEVREGGQGILGAGIHYDSDFNVALLLNATFKNVMIKGSKLFIDAGLGENPKTSVYYLVDRGKKPGFGIRYTYLNLDFSDHNKGTVEDVISTNDHKVEIFTQISLKNTTQFKAGIEYEYFKIRSNIYNPEDYNFNSYLNLFFSLAADSYDRSSFPTKGSHTEFKVKYVLSPKSDWLTELLDNALMIQLKHTKNIFVDKRNTFRAGIAAGATIKNKIPPFQHMFFVGGQNQNTVYDGFIPFTGLPFVEKTGMYVAVFNFAWQYNFYRDFYLTPKIDLGSLSTDFKTMFDPAKFMAGYGICFGYASFIGPVELTVMGSNWTKGTRGFINIGYYF